jgi:hypothetical protein
VTLNAAFRAQAIALTSSHQHLTLVQGSLRDAQGRLLPMLEKLPSWIQMRQAVASGTCWS